MSSAISKYENFNGRKVKSIRKEKFHFPKTLIYLGQAHSIEYVSNKFNGGGDGKKAIYVHKFETPVKLYMDETGKRQLYLKGSRLKVTSAGIEN